MESATGALMDTGIASDPMVYDWIADRHFRGLIHLGALSASVIGNLIVLGLYTLAYSVKPELLRHTLHKLLIILFLGNLIGSACFAVSLFVDPESMGCKFSVLGFVGAFAAEYYSSLMICGLLCSSLVLNSRSPSRAGEIAMLLIPTLIGVGIAIATAGGTGRNPGDGGCFFREPLGPQALSVLIGAALPVLVNLVLVFIISVRLSRKSSRMAAEQLRVKGTGILATNKASSDYVAQLSQRLIMYPVLILLCGGTSIVSTIFTDIKIIAFIGEIAITIGGLANTVAFLAFDPSAAKLAGSILDAYKSPSIAATRIGYVGSDVNPAHELPLQNPHIVVREPSTPHLGALTAAQAPNLKHTIPDRLLTHSRSSSSSTLRHSRTTSLASLSQVQGQHNTLSHSRTSSSVSDVTLNITPILSSPSRPSLGLKRSTSEAPQSSLRHSRTPSNSSSEWLTCSEDDSSPDVEKPSPPASVRGSSSGGIELEGGFGPMRRDSIVITPRTSSLGRNPRDGRASLGRGPIWPNMIPDSATTVLVGELASPPVLAPPQGPAVVVAFLAPFLKAVARRGGSGV
ncbi:hypothetical protein M427DRAFT_34649 [Gonapodya prolifera JEL478]|uniref:Uncharacterized protein n=1 Tax=Gonapodya prolifera (strain JEL478) TaxID=1344416 RepID=A0A139A8D1_GONPJ|nr:hypothetical protein M427DRAFT_34649 [Gonapodya prolifera JEL478]|eukprot:KXS12643.1 hypothetical protein M427DRAFT_34649 [Gonapodya prolifera JEL478]